MGLSRGMILQILSIAISDHAVLMGTVLSERRRKIRIYTKFRLRSRVFESCCSTSEVT